MGVGSLPALAIFNPGTALSSERMSVMPRSCKSSAEMDVTAMGTFWMFSVRRVAVITTSGKTDCAQDGPVSTTIAAAIAVRLFK